MKHLWVFEPNKLKIIQALYNCPNNLCGCDLIKKLGIPKNLLSHHMKILKTQQFVLENKQGRRCQYVINPDYRHQIKNILLAVEIIPGSNS